jgi:hypothetical protein
VTGAWRTSSRCAANGSCVQITWRRSSRCMNDSNCAEIARHGGAVLVRSSFYDSGHLALTRQGFAALLNTIKETP